MAYVIPVPEQTAIAVAGSSDLFPVGRIYCVGRNYAEHAREMGHDPDREPPFFFQKHAGAVLAAAEPEGADFPYPSVTSDLHHEIELVVAMQSGGAAIKADKALDHVWGYGVGIDMTRRDIQGEAKKLGRPWDGGKSFENAAPMGNLHPASKVGHPDSGDIWLDVNGTRRQSGNLNQLIWSVPEIIEYLSTLFVLKAGDLIMTGTPAGVAAVSKGDELVGGVAGLSGVRIRIV